MDTIEKTAPNLMYLQPPLLLHNDAGRFTRVTTSDVLQSAWAGRGAASGDIDNDGDTDLVVSNVGQKAVLLRNDGGNRNGWLEIRAIGTRSNRDGIGARVRVVTASGLATLHHHHYCRLLVGERQAINCRIGRRLDGQAG